MTVSDMFRYFGIDPEKKIFLIAPTHREGISDQKMNLDEIDNVLAALGERFGGEWVVLIRVHNRIKKKAAIWYKDYGALYNASLYPDMQELLCAADCGMTDYSSWIFDYMESYKPAFIVEYDLADFEDARGFYYPIESTPFPIVETLADLPEAILSFEEKSYKEKVKLFLEEKGCIDDGKSSERIADFVLELLQK